MANVYGWPDVGAVSAEWSFVQPISSSVSSITGKRYASAYQRERRIAQVAVSSLARGQMGAGYSEMLKRLLAGGENLVRLYSTPINWHLGLAHTLEGLRQGDPMGWEAPPDAFGWETPPDEFTWVTGAAYSFTTTTLDDMPAIVVSGLPPRTLVIHPGEFVLFDGATSIMAAAPATSNASGVATIKLFSAAPVADGVELGARETGVFQVIGDLPRSMQPLGVDWQYGWTFQEVFADEVGGFTEIPDWWRGS